VQTVVAKTGVSESAFYEVFATLEECYRSAYKDGLERVAHAIAAADDDDRSWLGRLRARVVALLGFLDDEPAWGRMLVLETAACEAPALEPRKQLHDVLIALLGLDEDQSAILGSSARSSALTGELVAGGVLSVIRASMLEDDGTKLVELAPSLVSFIATQYGHPATTAEQARGSERARSTSRAAELPIRATHRTTLVLRAIARTPYSNNREIAQAAGLVDEGQTSKLLARLERQGVIENVGVGAARGEPNAWLLTESGRHVVDVINEGPNSAARPRSVRARGVA
jgi:AcrR family transcriptional regulator